MRLLFKRLTLVMSWRVVCSLSQRQAASRSRSHAQPKKAAVAQKKSATGPSSKSRARPPRRRPPRINIVPEGALGIAVIRNLGELDEKLNALAKGLQIPAPPALMTLRQLIGIGEGLDEKGAVGARHHATGGGRRTPAADHVCTGDRLRKIHRTLQPADAKAAQTEVTIAGRPHSVMKKGNYAVLSQARRPIA